MMLDQIKAWESYANDKRNFVAIIFSALAVYYACVATLSSYDIFSSILYLANSSKSRHPSPLKTIVVSRCVAVAYF